MDEARKRGVAVAGHVSEDTLTILEAIRGGQRSIEHVRDHLILCFARDDGEVRDFYDADGWSEDDRAWGERHRADCPAIWAELRRGSTWLTPTLAVERTWIDGLEPGFVDDPRRARQPTPVRNAVAQQALSLRGRSAEERAQAEHWWGTQLAFVARAKAERAPMLAGSDASCEGVIAGFGLHDQLALFVAAGLAPLEALRTATLEPAAYFERSARSGEIASGHDADILLLRADPRNDIGAVKAIEAVILRGDLLDREALDRLSR